METLHLDDDTRLPPIASTPRFLTAPVTSQPVRCQTPARSARKIEPEALTTRDTPRRSLKQVCRGHRAWTTGICECRDDLVNCFFSCVFPCCIKWSIAKYFGETQCTALVPGSSIPMRTKIRAVGGIKGSVLGDICVVCCCPCLGLSQMMREVDHMIVQPEIYVKPVKF